MFTKIKGKNKDTFSRFSFAKTYTPLEKMIIFSITNKIQFKL